MDPDGGRWLARTTTVETVIDATHRTIERTVTSNGDVASQITTTYSKPFKSCVPNTPCPIDLSGVEVATHESVVVDQSGATIETEVTYQTDPSANGYGKLLLESTNDGSWVAYKYDDKGRPIRESRPWLDSPPPAAGSPGGAYDVDFAYTSTDSQDVMSADHDLDPRMITESIEGKPLSVTTRSFSGAPGAPTKESVNVKIVCGSPDCSSPRNLISYKNFNPLPTDPKQQRLDSELTPDGVLTSYKYDGLQTTITRTDTTGNVVAGKSTQEIETEDAFGNVVSRAAYVATGGGFSSTVTELRTIPADSNNHVTHVDSGSAQHDAEWGWRFLASETDERGIKTSYQYDAIGRRTTVTTDGPKGLVVTTYAYDGADRITDEVVSAPFAEPQIIHRTYDYRGRILTALDAAGRSVTTVFDDVNRTQVMTSSTSPEPTVETTTRHADGQVKSVVTNAGVSRSIDYQIDGAGAREVVESFGDAGFGRTRTTKIDGAGQVVQVTQPGHPSEGTSGDEVATSEYNTVGKLSKMTQTGKAPTLFFYDAIGQLFSQGLDKNGDGQLTPGADRYMQLETTFVADTAGVWEQKTETVFNDASNPIVVAQRKDLLSLATFQARQQIIDVRGNVTDTTLSVDRASQSQQKTTSYPDGTADTTVYYRGAAQTFAPRTGSAQVTYDFDGLGRRKLEIDQRSAQTVTTYVAQGPQDIVTDGRKTHLDYDGWGRVKAVTNPLGKVTRYDYDAWGHVVDESGDVPVKVHRVYDALGQLTEVDTFRDGATPDVVLYKPEPTTGLLASRTDALGQVTTFGYGPGGRLSIRSWARPGASGGTADTKYAYDPATGDLTDITYPNDPATAAVHFDYDILGRRKLVTDGAGSRTFAFNDPVTGTDNLQLVDEIFAGGPTIHHGYDASGPVVGRVNELSILGAAAGSPAYDVKYHYDSKGRGWDQVSWSASGLVGESAGQGVYHYQDSDALLDTLTSGSAQHAGLVSTTFGYKENRYLRNQTQNQLLGSTLLSQYKHEYDELDRMQYLARSGSAFAPTPGPTIDSFCYDNMNQLTSAVTFPGGSAQGACPSSVPCGSGLPASPPVVTGDAGGAAAALPGRAMQYAYDCAGNRNAAVEANNAGTTTAWAYTPNAADEYVSRSSSGPPASQYNFSYDADGNLLGALNGSKDTVYTYDAENRLVRAAPKVPAAGDNRVDFQYDYRSRRSSKTEYQFQAGVWVKQATTVFYYDEEHLIREDRTTAATPPQTTTRYFVWGLEGAGGLLASAQDGKSRIYVHDTRGNVGQVVDGADGSIVAQYDYDAFGNTVASSGAEADANPFRWASRYFDEAAGLYSYGSLDYSPALGRWMSRGSDVHPYRFADNAPTNVGVAMAANDLGDGLGALLDLGRSHVTAHESLRVASRHSAGDQRHRIENTARAARAASVAQQDLAAMFGRGLLKGAATSAAVLGVAIGGSVAVSAVVGLVVGVVTLNPVLGVAAALATFDGIATAAGAAAAAAGPAMAAFAIAQIADIGIGYANGSIDNADLAEIAGEAIGGAVVGGTVLRGVSGLRRLAAASSRATAVAAAEAGGVLESEVAGTRLLPESTLEGGEASRMAGAECTGGACPCFVAGTPVDTGAGVKPIEEVSLGDRVGPSRSPARAWTVVIGARWICAWS